MKRFEHFNAKTIDEAVSLLRKYNGEAKLIAGGTDLIRILKDDVLPKYPKVIINLKTIDGLSYIKEEEGTLKIGALTKLNEIANSAHVKTKYGVLAEACRSVGTPQIRYMGTIVGNLCQDVQCWYYRASKYVGKVFNCLRKGGGIAWAIIGDHRSHSIFGSVYIPGSTGCSQRCPINIEIPLYVKRLKSGDLLGAARLLLKHNPLPSITGRVCSHFCEEGCTRGKLDEAVSIKLLERFLGDYTLENATEVIPVQESKVGKNVAIVGSGPAGLSAAYYLRTSGYDVTVFERMNEPGGLLRYGIPPFRLPKTIVKKVTEIFDDVLGIRFKLNIAVGEKIGLEELMNNFDAVLLASGAWEEIDMRIPGEELMISGLDFLEKVNSGIRKIPGRKVAVIGGGNVAIDVSRVLIRMGAEPTIIYRRSAMEMPALREAVEAAKSEGIKFDFLKSPVEVREKNGKILLKCVRMKLGTPDKTGRPTPVPIEGSEFTVEFDAAVKAIGEKPDISYVPSEFIDHNKSLKVDILTQHLGRNLFAAGDFITGPSTVAAAISSGKKGALSIDHYLLGKKGEKQKENVWERLNRIDPECLTIKPRIKAQVLSVSERIKSLDVEDVAGLDFSKIEYEASRCLQCGCIASHPSDVAPALIVLNAKVITNKRVIPIEEFFDVECMKTTVLDADEIVIEIQVPMPKLSIKSKFMKFALRKSIDFSIVNCAVAVGTDGDLVKEARICLNGVFPIPYRATKAEEYLKGKLIDESIAEEASKKAIEDANPLPMTTYKVQIAKTLVKRAILACR